MKLREHNVVTTCFPDVTFRRRIPDVGVTSCVCWVMPALKSPSVIVLDNASYHNIKTEETVVPNFNQRKAVLQDYVSKHNIPFQPLEIKKTT